jgi:hypothetical protein
MPREADSRQTWLIIGLLVCGSSLIRGAMAWRHVTPRYFPDEYIYATLGRSIGHGHYAIRGVTAHFPGLVEPLLAAPIWRLFSTTTAYHLVQVENSVAASLAAVPIYALAHWLGLSRRYACLCAALALLIPSLVLVAFTMSDIVAFPLVVAAVASGVAAIDQPNRRRQLTFLAFVTLACFTRVQYFVLVPAYLAGALAVDRRKFLRAHRAAFIAIAPAVLVVLVAALGYYGTGISQTRINAHFVGWYFLQAFLLAVEAGVVLVPGAVAALVAPNGRRELAFAAFTGTFTVLLLGEATAHAADSLQFKERYLFVLLALVPVAFGLYLKHDGPRRLVVVGLAIAIALAAARLPLSGYATGRGKSDSQFLMAVSYAQERLGVSEASLLIALLATAGAAGAVAIAFRDGGRIALGVALAVAAITTITAIHVDIRGTNAVRAQYAPNLTWVDDAAKGTVTAIATPFSLQADLLYQLYWNASIQREFVLDNGIPTDAFSAPLIHIGRDGRLAGSTREILLPELGTTATFAEAKRVAHIPQFSLWRVHAHPRFRLLLEGRFFDQWLGPFGRLRAWPLRTRRAAIKLSFRLSLPSDWGKTVHLKLGPTTFVVHPGSQVDVVCRSTSGPVDAVFESRQDVRFSAVRDVTVQLTDIRTTDVPARASNTQDGETACSSA